MPLGRVLSRSGSAADRSPTRSPPPTTQRYAARSGERAAYRVPGAGPGQTSREALREASTSSIRPYSLASEAPRILSRSMS